MIRAIPFWERQQIWAVKTRKWSIIQIAEKGTVLPQWEV